LHSGKKAEIVWEGTEGDLKKELEVKEQK